MLLTDITNLKNNDMVKVKCDQCNAIRTIKLICYKKKQKRTKNDLCSKCSVDGNKISRRMKKEWLDKEKMSNRFGKDYIETQRKNAIKMWKDDSYKDKQHAYKNSKEHKCKMSEIISNKWTEDNFRNKVTESMNSTDVKLRISKSSQETAKHKYDNNFFKTKSNSVHNDKYEYSESNYKNSSSKILITCPKHGQFNQIANDHMQGHGCPKCSTVISKGQQEVIDFISQLGIQTIINDRKILDGKEIDILLPDLKIGIEFNGLYWHSCHNDPTYLQKNRHKFKTSLADTCGIKLIQIFDNEWNAKKDLIQSMIMQRCGIVKKIYARKLTIENIKANDARLFYNKNHMHGFKPSYCHYGLVENSKIIMMLSFTKNNDWFEISRLATEIGYSVVGGFSKLLKHHLKSYDNKIITYCDRRFSNRNNVYEKNNFKLVNITKPNYLYYDTKSCKTIARQNMQKHKLKNILHTFNENLTEMQNCIKNGFYPVFDCGHYKYEFTPNLEN